MNTSRQIPAQHAGTRGAEEIAADRDAVSGGRLRLRRQHLGAQAQQARHHADACHADRPAHFRRAATRDVELHGQTIKAGDKMVVWWPSGNRDETVFADPYRLVRCDGSGGLGSSAATRAGSVRYSTVSRSPE